MPKSVLISGASSGIGKALSLELEKLGYQVFAGVRNPNDADELSSQATPRLKPVILDITLPETISTTCGIIAEATGGKLSCLINNAGINLSGALEFLPIQDFRQQLEVNVTSQLALTQACLPMLREAGGRMIFVSSVAGRMTTPFNGPYAASKAALVAVADALRLELAPWGIFVTALIVGSVRTPIWEKSAHKAGEILRRSPKEAWQMYGAQQKLAGAFYKQAGLNGIPVEKVVQVTSRLIESSHPKAYVLIGWDAVVIELIAKLLPVRSRDWIIRKRMGLY